VKKLKDFTIVVAASKSALQMMYSSLLFSISVDRSNYHPTGTPMGVHRLEVTLMHGLIDSRGSVVVPEMRWGETKMKLTFMVLHQRTITEKRAFPRCWVALQPGSGLLVLQAVAVHAM